MAERDRRRVAAMLAANADLEIGPGLAAAGDTDLHEFTDAASFLGTYVAKGILEIDPFISVDRDGVGELVKIGVARGRKTRPDLKIGICGEHGGDPASVAFCHEIGLDYVSCSPYRVPIARLAAAQAALGKTVASQA